MTEDEIKRNAPLGSTHYFILPWGSGDPYYVFMHNGNYYYRYNGYQIYKSYILELIKPL